MGRMDVGQAFGPAFNNMLKALFRPFEFRKWLALGFVTLFSAAGGGNLNLPRSGPNSGNSGPPDYWVTGLAHHIPLVIAITVAFVALVFLLAWIGSVLRFVYMDQITRNSGAIREPFARLKKLGTSFFLWRLAFGFIVLMVIGGLVTAAVLTFALTPESAIAPRVIAVVLAVVIGLPLILLAIIIGVLTGDFMTAAMYARNVKTLEALRIVIPIVRANAGQTALYLLLLLPIAIVTSIGSLLVMLLTGIVVAIPAGMVALVGYLVWQAAHLTWTPVVIGVTVAIGVGFATIWIYAINCAMQPFVVFRRSFALVVMGQTDPSLVTVPIAAIPPAPIEAPQGE